jgi:muramidase (phage lysozyme)
MANDGSVGDKVKADQKVMLQAKYDMEQKILGLNRTESDRQAAFTDKLEKFKLETAKASGRIQQAYAEKSGQLVEGYTTAAAKILMTGGQNAGAALEASAARSAQALTSALAAANSGGGGVGAGGNYKIDDIADKTLPAATRALLKTIRFAEGTAGENGYRTMFTGKLFTDMSKHPRAIQRGGGYASDAAGAYQFLSPTWDGIGGGAMTPARQDRGAVALARRRGVDTAMPQGFTKDVADRLAPEWASFPTKATGTSYYGQGGKSFEVLKSYYDRELAKEQAFDRGSAQQSSNPTGPNSIFQVNGPNTPSPIFQAKADPIAALANSGRQGAMQAPNTKPERPLGQKAVKNGKPVVWNGRDYVPDTISAAAAPVGGAAAAPAGGGAPANNIVPLPAGFNPASVGSVNANQFLGGVQQAQNGLNSLAGKEKELQTEQAVTEYLKQQAAQRAAMTGDLNTQLSQTQLSLEADQQRLELLRSGVNPAYAEQFVQIDQMAQAEQTRLTAERDRIKELLKDKTLRPDLIKGLEEDLANTEDRLAAEGGITQQIKDQIAAREALKNSPGTKITEKVAQMKTELADTGGMIISLADTIEGELGSAMSNAISGIISGTTTAEEAFSQMFKNIGAAFIDMATKMIAKALIMKVLGILGGGASGGTGSIFGGGAELSSGFSGTGSAVGDWSFFADGGYVTGPTNAVIGENGEDEYVIPASKMGAAMQRYSTGSRGSNVIPGSGGGSSGESEGGGTTTIDVGYRVTEINSVTYVTEAEFQSGMRQAAQQGAAAGHQKVFGDLRNSRSRRSRVGLG